MTIVDGGLDDVGKMVYFIFFEVAHCSSLRFYSGGFLFCFEMATNLMAIFCLPQWHEIIEEQTTTSTFANALL